MNEEEIRDEARKAANRSQFMSNHVYDHKSYEDGFYEGMKQALRINNIAGKSEDLVCEYCDLDKPTCCDSCLESIVDAAKKSN